MEKVIGSRDSERDAPAFARLGATPLLCLNSIPLEPSALSGGGATHGGGLLRPLRLGHGDRPSSTSAAKLYALAAVATPVVVEIVAAQFRVFSERPYPRGPASGEDALENGLKNDQQRCHKVQAAYLRPEQPENAVDGIRQRPLRLI